MVFRVLRRGWGEELSQALQKWDLVNAKPHPVVMALRTGGWLLFSMLMLLSDKQPSTQHWAQIPHPFPGCLLKNLNMQLLASWPLIQGHSPLNMVFVYSSMALGLS